MPTLNAFIKSLLIATGLGLLGSGLFIYSGIYPIGADVPHNKLTLWLITTMRDQSIHNASSSIEVPSDLETPERLLSGGSDYDQMCASCHLQPGKDKNDLTLGLYPPPPNLFQIETENHEGHAHSDKENIKRQFWVIKHGIKATGMPAWGPTHSDERIWNMVAFLQRLPELSKDQYQVLTSPSHYGEGSSDH